MKRLAIFCVVACACAGAALGLQVRTDPSRFDGLTIPDPSKGLDVATTDVASLPSADALRAAWQALRGADGRDERVWLDRRSGAPLLAHGKGPSLGVAAGADIDTLASALRHFASDHRALLLADDAEMTLDRDGSGEVGEGTRQIVFDHVVSGVPVEGERYVFTVGRGRVTSFGATRWSRVAVSTVPRLDASEAQAQLAAYMGLTARDTVQVVMAPALTILPMRASERAGRLAGKYAGPFGAGYASALVWKIGLHVEGEPGVWIGQIDAHSGAIRSFVDGTSYVRVKGGVYPISDDQNCPDGCEQPGTILPFADVTINATTSNATTLGTFSCSPSGAVATTALNGPYVKVVDTCGPIAQSVTCSADLDLGGIPGIDCAVAPGASAGNTHAARTSFYHLNRIAEHARTWLPTRPWLASKLTDNVNLNQVCNAYWDGTAVNFFKSSASCNNTGEIAGVFLHEWGHGLDQNDGGGFDDPSEAYGDITSLMATHVSCLGRGFRKFGNCGGYGNFCLNCSGVRDSDWDQHADHVPSTPAGFAATHCVGGDGPCGLEQHCESLVSSEALWDLATRDLPAMGLDLNSAWQLADKLWYKSRLGSGGNAYNCALPESDGCTATSWFEKILIADDDDSDPSNGTPHAAAIFAAFDRHGIACGLASDAANQNSTTCPSIGTTALTATAGPTAATLSWTPVANSIGYRILRNDAGCQAAMTRLSILTGTTFTDTGLINGVPLYYTIQAIANNGACDGPLSSCQAVTPQSGAGTIKLDATSYACTGQLGVTVTDGNIGANTATVSVSSTTETATESITVTRVSPGSATYSGTIALTGSAPVHDGVLSVSNGDTITARYADANDGAGHFNQQRVTTATASCPVVNQAPKPVPDGSFGTAMTASRADAGGASIGLTWDVSTCASTDHHLLYGDLASLASLTVLGAACDLGTTGSATWSAVPAGDLWFVLAGDDGVSVEGSWGTDGSGAQRGASTVSGQCGMVTRDNSGSCP